MRTLVCISKGSFNSNLETLYNPQATQTFPRSYITFRFTSVHSGTNNLIKNNSVNRGKEIEEMQMTNDKSKGFSRINNDNSGKSPEVYKIGNFILDQEKNKKWLSHKSKHQGERCIKIPYNLNDQVVEHNSKTFF